MIIILASHIKTKSKVILNLIRYQQLKIESELQLFMNGNCKVSTVANIMTILMKNFQMPVSYLRVA